MGGLSALIFEGKTGGKAMTAEIIYLEQHRAPAPTVAYSDELWEVFHAAFMAWERNPCFETLHARREAYCDYFAAVQAEDVLGSDGGGAA